MLWSFDLDTLQPLRRAVITNFAVLQAGNPTHPGDVVHAVDEDGGRIFLAGLLPQTLPREMQVIVIDEGKLDQGLQEADFVTRRLEVPPNQRGQVQLGGPIVTNPDSTPAGGAMRGMAFSMASGNPKLLILFGSVNTTVSNLNPPSIHWVAQWDPEIPGEDYGDWIVRLAGCERANLVTYQGWKYQLEVIRGLTAVYAACAASTTTVVRLPLLAPDGTEDPNGVPNEGIFDAFPIPRLMSNVFADPESERLLVEVQLLGFTWWVFDGRERAWVGGAGQGVGGANGLDSETGRFYALVPDSFTQGPDDHGQRTPTQGGLRFTDIRLTPAAQFTNAIPSLAYNGQFRVWIDPESPERARRVFVRRGNATLGQMVTYPGTSADTPSPVEDFYLVIEDTVPIAIQPPTDDLDKNTIEVLDEPGITGANFDVLGSGFGFRGLLVGGITPAISREMGFAMPAACFNNDRELVIGQVETARLSNVSTSGKSISLFADVGTKADLENPSSRCWPGTLGTNLDPSIPATVDPLAGQEWETDADGRDAYTAECSGDQEKPIEAAAPERIEAAYSSWVECKHSDSLVRGFASGRVSPGGTVGPVSVMSASSKVNAAREEGGGTIVEVEAIARGIEIAGVGSIGVIRTVAVARSAGRPGTAETSFDRFICNVEIPGLQLNSCLTDEQQEEFVSRLNQLLIRMNGKARLRNPEPEFQDGTSGGYLAAIQRNSMEALDDEIVTRDFSKTVPGLQIVFYRGDSPTEGSGRQVFQFAAVQASSAYGIFCLFGEVETNNQNTKCVRPTSELRISLTDDFEENPTPLPGGVFEIHADSDGDGLMGVDDQVLELGDEKAICTTVLDGTGDCVFQVPPGNYVVHQVKAPDGFAPAPDCSVSLPAFASKTCEFVNSPRIGLIYVGLTDDSSDANPLAGGVFELYVDDGDEQIGKGDTKLASCTTDLFGDCIFKLSDIQGAAVPIYCTASALEAEDALDLIQIECIFDIETGGNILAVELGKFIVHQAEAPPDYQPASDQIIDLKKPWDRGISLFVNGLKAIEETPPIEIPGTGGRQSSVVIEEGSSQPRAPSVRSQTKARPEAPSVVTRILNAPADAFNFLLRHPKEAVMFGFMWMLLVGPIWLTWRRRSISTLGGAG